MPPFPNAAAVLRPRSSQSVTAEEEFIAGQAGIVMGRGMFTAPLMKPEAGRESGNYVST